MIGSSGSGADTLQVWPAKPQDAGRLTGSEPLLAIGLREIPSRPATFMYMSGSVGVAELRQNLSVYLARVKKGERLVVTDRNRPVAELGPAPSTGPDLDRLIAEGRVTSPVRSGLPEPLDLTGNPRALSQALDDIRGDR